MHKIWWYFPLLLGIILVVQTGLNEQVQKNISFAHTLLFNNIAFITLTLCLLTLQYYYADSFPDNFNANKNLSFSWWFIIPGILGAFYVAGNIYSYDKVGASHTVILIVIAQIITSMLWDYFVKDKSINFKQILGAGFAIVGVFLVISKD